MDVDVEEFYVPDVLEEASAEVPNGACEIKIMIPEIIGNMYLHNGRPRNGSREKMKML
jgi:hypothetical protein